MQWELSELNLQTVILLQFLDTPGDEVAPRSNKIGKDFENERLRHDRLLSLSAFLILLTSVPGSQRSGIGFVPIYSILPEVENNDPFRR
jgi:hypothetical protein